MGIVEIEVAVDARTNDPHAMWRPVRKIRLRQQRTQQDWIDAAALPAPSFVLDLGAIERLGAASCGQIGNLARLRLLPDPPLIGGRIAQLARQRRRGRAQQHRQQWQNPSRQHLSADPRCSGETSRSLPARLAASLHTIALRGHGLEQAVADAHNRRMTRSISIAGISLELEQLGSGRTLLFLHPGEGLQPRRPWLDLLARRYRVIAPQHPGWGNSSLPDWLSSVEDLAYLYLDLATVLDLTDAALVGVDFGGWVAAEMAVRDTRRFASMVLADPLGIKVGGVMERDIADMHAMPRDEYLRLAWADPAKGEIDYTQLAETGLAAIARGREAFALFGWKPYMHNPRLRRWLHRIDVPTLLLWGEQDGIIRREYCQAWCGEIPEARLETIANAGHFPHWEQPEAFAEHLSRFIDTH
jgi:pimeloyl-ACP methyl ester carboxylesterase